ncbi:hypothetical protein TBLA_0C01230 [Henningerozyma blattae CBS 6284]|uniref:Uncharacterized protein n=1 Tax=Henningerozyma blattae (strain ATCC 34711 / CBS 6284 / DSM 70876 / NBRC 10599 / NRRL Y-10934 / UCD 77-7) TaxID=1071380 RepID=I2H0N6_HENB6|nr:hypothetical protein TBLA_0C01230 [Tetrapisispora blattae CBS 6284]CCH59938.1 hypothetical protein TBLA_0C01230 [Tetrapisispora blattae CBS 6284]
MARKNIISCLFKIVYDLVVSLEVMEHLSVLVSLSVTRGLAYTVHAVNKAPSCSPSSMFRFITCLVASTDISGALSSGNPVFFLLLFLIMGLNLNFLLAYVSNLVVITVVFDPLGPKSSFSASLIDQYNWPTYPVTPFKWKDTCLVSFNVLKLQLIVLKFKVRYGASLFILLLNLPNV